MEDNKIDNNKVEINCVCGICHKKKRCNKCKNYKKIHSITQEKKYCKDCFYKDYSDKSSLPELSDG